MVRSHYFPPYCVIIDGDIMFLWWFIPFIVCIVLAFTVRTESASVLFLCVVGVIPVINILTCLFMFAIILYAIIVKTE